MRNNGLRALLVLLAIIAVMPVMVNGQRMEVPRVLVAYYSKGGNTEKMAECIARQTGGELYSIEPAVPYSDNKDSFLIRAKTEMMEGIMVELKDKDLRLEEYDVVFIGSPVWFGDWAAPAASFARNPILEGKRVIPFMTCGREEEGITDLLYKKYCSVANPERGLFIPGEKVANGKIETHVEEWVYDLFEIRDSLNGLTALNVVGAVRRMQKRYPKLSLCDIYKSFYQDYFGPGHIIASRSKAKKYIKQELKEVNGEGIGIEECGVKGDYVRVDLWKVKSGEIEMNDYLDMLVESVPTQVDTAGWKRQWFFVLDMISRAGLEIYDMKKSLSIVQNTIRSNDYTMRHSQVFNECYNPHYRIIRRDLYEKRGQSVERSK